MRAKPLDISEVPPTGSLHLPDLASSETVVSNSGAEARWLAEGARLHLNHGPIDLLLEVAGPRVARLSALKRACAEFDGVLGGLMAEIEVLRRPYNGIKSKAKGPVARRMIASLDGYEADFVTPMASVAGAVADHILAAMHKTAGLEFASVNNGGDIAFWQGARPTLRIAIVSDPRTGTQAGVVSLTPQDGISGVATSGWRGRSFSLGIADAVTVLAKNAAAADVGATLIANAVDLPHHSAITRARACDLAPDSDLGARLVVTDVGGLSDHEVGLALAAGARVADTLVARGAVCSVFLCLAGRVSIVGKQSNILT
ncbi:MAG: UPF0280 family protein [Alphaproteobacteria bacterium]|nr:UPF0280 family protein [Alphaproteobacteria bacterium]